MQDHNEVLTENHVEPYPNPPDISSCDFFLLPKLKNQLRGIQFDDDNALLTTLEQVIDSFTNEDFKNYFEDWFIRMHKSIDTEEQYFEKIH
jgi:hypothetical protein